MILPILRASIIRGLNEKYMEKKFYWLYVTVFINIVGVGMIFPILPLFAQQFNATSFEVGLLASTLAIVQFLAAPLMGKLSDRYGRKPVLLASIGANTFSFLVTGFAPSLEWVFLGMAIQGLGTAGVLPAALAYVADVSSGDTRSKFISRVTGTFALGFIVGPAVGGVLGSLALQTPFFVAFGVGLVNLIVISLFLQETLTKRDLTISMREGLINIKPLFLALKGEFGVLFYLTVVWGFYVTNFSITIPFYTQAAFGFDTLRNGLLFSGTGFTAAFTQWVILDKIEKKFGDLNAILIGIILLAVGLLAAPLIPFLPYFLIFAIMFVIGSSLTRPSVNSYLSKKTSEGQGVTMGLAFSFESLGRVIGPIVIGFSSASLGLTAPFYISAVLVLIGLVLFYFIELKRSH